MSSAKQPCPNGPSASDIWIILPITLLGASGAWAIWHAANHLLFKTPTGPWGQGHAKHRDEVLTLHPWPTATLSHCHVPQHSSWPMLGDLGTKKPPYGLCTSKYPQTADKPFVCVTLPCLLSSPPCAGHHWPTASYQQQLLSWRLCLNVHTCLPATGVSH